MHSLDNALTCADCGCDVSKNDTFCPECGGIFTPPIYCSTHPGVEAEGVCVICRAGFCEACGSRVNRISLCGIHSTYEIAEGMARVFGSEDNVQTQFVKNCLAQAALHPFFFSRQYNPGPDVSPQFSWRLFPDHNLQELKIFVPFKEVLSAQKILAALNITDPNRLTSGSS